MSLSLKKRLDSLKQMVIKIWKEMPTAAAKSLANRLTIFDNAQYHFPLGRTQTGRRYIRRMNSKKKKTKKNNKDSFPLSFIG